jgi:uncharacterized membrane protein YeiH
MDMSVFTTTQFVLEVVGIVAFALSVIMGMITAVFGGVLRDVVCNEIPRVFSDHRPYALCAFAGGWILVLAHYLGLPQWTGLFLGAVSASTLRVLAMVFDWKIPSWRT